MSGPVVSALVNAVVPPLMLAAKVALLTLLAAVLLMVVSVWAMRRVIRLFQSPPRKSASSLMDAEYKECSKPSDFDGDDWWESGETSLGRNYKF